MLWYKLLPELYESIVNYFNQYFKNVKVIEQNGIIIMYTHEISYNEKVLQEFEIEISFPELYPVDLPIVKEVSNKIPKIINRHLCIPNHEFCLMHPNEIKNKFPDNFIHIDTFMNLVTDFLKNQIYYDLYGDWINGEYSHLYPCSILQYYNNYYQIKNSYELEEVLYRCLERSNFTKVYRSDTRINNILNSLSINVIKNDYIIISKMNSFYRKYIPLYSLNYAYQFICNERKMKLYENKRRIEKNSSRRHIWQKETF
jgi:hypothetical protein